MCDDTTRQRCEIRQHSAEPDINPSATNREKWAAYSTTLHPEWAAFCEVFVDKSDEYLFKLARIFDFLVGARACFDRSDINDYHAVRQVLESRGYDPRTFLKFYFRNLETDPLSAEEYQEEARQLSEDGLIIVIPREQLRPIEELKAEIDSSIKRQ